MEGLNKKLAYGLWTVSAISALMSIINYISFEYYLGMISIVIALVFQGLLGYTILRDKNDKFTMISVILIAIFTFNLGGLVAIIMRLVLRKNDSDKIRNAWFVPAIVSGALALINLFLAFSFIGFVGLVLNVVYYLIFGYWFLKYLKVN
jgi:hypothetical protein